MIRLSIVFCYFFFSVVYNLSATYCTRQYDCNTKSPVGPPTEIVQEREERQKLGRYRDICQVQRMTKAVEIIIDHANEKVAVTAGATPFTGRNPSESSSGAMNAVAVDTVVRL